MTDLVLIATGESERTALDRLREREEVLEICFWYQGEGLGATFTPTLVVPFLNSDPTSVAYAFESLVEEGSLELAPEGDRYALTPLGRRKAGRMFTETFVEFQQPGHGECQDGCCDGDEPCAHNDVFATGSVRAFGADCGFAHRFGERCEHPGFGLRYRRP